MTNTARKAIIQNALLAYNYAKQSGDPHRISRAINDMENVFYCVSLFAVDGTENLRQAILCARSYKGACL